VISNINLIICYFLKNEIHVNNIRISFTHIPSVEILCPIFSNMVIKDCTTEVADLNSSGASFSATFAIHQTALKTSFHALTALDINFPIG